MYVITGEVAAQLRKKYITTFIDSSLPNYAEHISQLKKYTDGECYTGYLWDYLSNASTITELQAFKELKAATIPVYIMWDIHSCENIFIPDYWKYPKSSIININSYELTNYLPTFPEDIYIFPQDYSWTVSLTHEYIGKNRYCRYIDLRK